MGNMDETSIEIILNLNESEQVTSQHLCLRYGALQ
jgi:hypothetical protein